MIQVNNLTKILGDKKVIDELSLTINDNSIFGLVGINGAGKSTLLRCLTGIYQQDGGEILIDGKNVYENNEVKQNILFIPDEPFITQNTTIKSLIDFYSSFYKFNKDEFYAYLEKFNIEKTKKSINTFSKGMKRRVLLCFILAIHPKYLILDEAFDGLDPLGKLNFKKEIASLMEKYTMTVIIASHSLRELEAICDSFAMMNKGKLVSSGDIDSNNTSLYKVQMSFKEDIDLAIFKEQEILNKKKTMHIITLVVKLPREKIEEIFSKYSPLTLDILELTFEETFIYETEAFDHE